MASESISGHMRWLRSRHKDADDCICCDGAHIIGRILELRGVLALPGQSAVSTWLRDVARRIPENGRFTITVEWEKSE